MRSLDGITVVALEHAVAVPFCTRQLADLGARVIKVERPGVGDFARAYDTRVRGMSSCFVWANRSKESLSLNLKHPKAREILHALLGKADILVQNLAPGAAERLGLGYTALSERYPRLIVCDVSGYGSDGPLRDRKAYDLMIQSEAGFLSVTGSAQQPAKAGLSIADIAAGMYALTNILSALIERGRTGKGCHIEVSMLESLVEWMGFPLYYAFGDATPPARSGTDHATIYPYGAFHASDGQTVMVGIQNEREWASFCERVLELPQLEKDPRFSSNSGRSAARDELRGIIEAVFENLTAEEVRRRLDVADIANASVNDMSAVWAHAQLAARRRWTEVDTPMGRIPALYPPGASLESPPPMRAVPALGQHTDSLLRELGLAEPAIAALRSACVI